MPCICGLPSLPMKHCWLNLSLRNASAVGVGFAGRSFQVDEHVVGGAGHGEGMINHDPIIMQTRTRRRNRLISLSLYIYTSTPRCRGNSRCLKKLGHIDQEMVQIRANIVCFLKISEVYFSPRPWLPIKARTHTLSSPGPAQRPQPRLGSQFDTWLDCGLVKEVKLPYSSRANWRRYCPRIF